MGNPKRCALGCITTELWITCWRKEFLSLSEITEKNRKKSLAVGSTQSLTKSNVSFPLGWVFVSPFTLTNLHQHVHMHTRAHAHTQNGERRATLPARRELGALGADEPAARANVFIYTLTRSKLICETFPLGLIGCWKQKTICFSYWHVH